MQAVRDRILAELAQNFNAEQLQMIDLTERINANFIADCIRTFLPVI